MVYGTKSVRRPAVAGSFYPKDQKTLRDIVSQFFSYTEKLSDRKTLKALIVPHAGYIYSGRVAAWGFRQLSKTNNQHIVLIGPSHYFSFSGLVCDDHAYWQTPLGDVKHIEAGNTYDVTIDSRPHIPEHCLEVQLPFLQHYLGNTFSCTAFLTGFNLSIPRIADYLMIHFDTSVFIISSDLSHYLPEQTARVKDEATIEAIIKGDSAYVSREENIACGYWGILLLMELAKRNNWRSQRIAYDTSGASARDYSRVVGYTAIGFYE